MRFDPESFIFGIKHSGPVGDIVSYVMGRAFEVAKEVWNTITNVAIATFTAVAAPARALVIDIDPVQDLHGYDHPWPAGGGKNKMPNAIPKTETINGITFKLDDFGVFTVTGTATAEAICEFPIGFSFVIPGGDPKPKIVFHNTQSNSVEFRFFNNSSQVDTWGLAPTNRVQVYDGMRGKTCNSYRIAVPSGTTVNMTISPMIVENSVTDYTYIPYSNICPISGWTEANIYRYAEYDADAQPTIAIPIGQTVYGGTLDVVNGVLTVNRVMVDLGTIPWVSHDSLANVYTGEGITLPKWVRVPNGGVAHAICSAYVLTTSAAGGVDYIDFSIAIGTGTSTRIYVHDSAASGIGDFRLKINGVQLVYELANPITYQLTPQEVTTLLGANNIWADTGNINTITYRES